MPRQSYADAARKGAGLPASATAAVAAWGSSASVVSSSKDAAMLSPKNVPAAKAEKPVNAAILSYLLAYNVAAMVGWAYVNALIAAHYYGGGSHAGVWGAIQWPLKVVMTAAVLEVLHAVTGLVRSDAMTAAIQVFARLLVLFAMINIAPPAQASVFCALCVTSWALVEVPRYAFYVFELLRVPPPAALKWLRYSLFIPLYPCGIAGEVGCLLAALPHVAAGGPWRVVLPFVHHAVTWHHAVFLRIALALYVPAAPYMVGHMWAMRKKKLGGGKAAAKVE